MSFERITKAVEYIEDNLGDPLTIADIASSVSYSPYHFQRVFHAFSNFSVQEYVRNRKLTLAAKELLSQDIKIIDVSSKYGYESPEAFSRAFKKLHGVSPSSIKKGSGTLKNYPKLTIEADQEDKKLEYSIESKEEFYLLGKTKRFTQKQVSDFKDVPRFCEELIKEGHLDRILDMAGAKETVGASISIVNGELKFDYLLGAIVDKDIKNDKYELVKVPTCMWAVFAIKGALPGSLENAWKNIFTNWFPKTSFEHRGLPELEVFPEGDKRSDDYCFYIWIPVKVAN